MAAAEGHESRKNGGIRQSAKVIFQALILALIVRTFLFQPFNIPSGSMKDTLLVGDYLIVSKYSYGYSRYSLPFGLHLFDGRLWASPPERGDIAVFALPRDPSIDYIKRVIGLPGDRIQVRNGLVYINGQVVKRERVGDAVTTDPFGAETQVRRYRQTLPNGVSYMTLATDPSGPEDNTPIYEVPAGKYFMMGDNRDDSLDSRVDPQAGGVGFVPIENFVGKAQIIFFSVDGGSAWEFWKWPWTVRWNRILSTPR